MHIYCPYEISNTVNFSEKRPSNSTNILSFRKLNILTMYSPGISNQQLTEVCI